MSETTSHETARSMATIGSKEGLSALLARSPRVDAPAVAREVRLAGPMHGDIETQLRMILKTTAFRLVGPDRVRLQGSDTSHHHVDPSLLDFARQDHALRWLRVSGERYDLYCEDSWTGSFIARQLAVSAADEPLVIIHVDDHMDMSPTMLAEVGADLRDPIAGEPFDPANSGDWQRSIVSGAVGIGNFLTPLLFQPRAIHIRHLCESLPHIRPAGLQLANIHEPLLPDLVFASPRQAQDAIGEGGSSYARSADASELCAELPHGRLIVHIDIDYFVNDFNGNAGGHAMDLDERKRQPVLRRMDRLFEAVSATKRPVARWMIATSPGFCAFRHWAWLLDELGQRIDATP